MNTNTRALPSDMFCQAWGEHKIANPIIVLIGGYAGTGKSTLAARLARQLAYTQVIPTGIFRSIAQTQSNPQQNPALFLSTYDCHTLYGSDQQAIIRAYKEQCAPVTSIIQSVISFMAIEKQHLIIEGNHVLPWEQYFHPGCHVIELYMYVKDREQHKKMLGGPTHNRVITPSQFKTGRAIHDMLCAKTRSNEKELFECAEMDKAEAYLQQEISKVLQNTMAQEAEK